MSITVSDFASLQAALQNPPADGLIYLSNNILVTSQLSVPSTVTIDGQGFTLDGQNFAPTSPTISYFFNVPATGNLTLQNITLNGENMTPVGAVFNAGNFTLNVGSILTGFNNPQIGAVNNTGTFTMNDGAITNNSGSAVNNTGTFTMNGGSLDHNTVSGVGGGVHNALGTFIMNGGTIANNSASNWGGGIFTAGTFTMNGGIVTGNSATYGGGIYLNPGTNQINCGEIANNSASQYGGGVFSNTDGTVIGTTCSDSPSTYTPPCDISSTCDCPTCTLQPGYCLVIHDNTAPRGGGLYYNTTSATIGCALISHNSAPSGGGGGICFDHASLAGTVTLNQTALTCNSALYGGGIFTSAGSQIALTINGASFLGNVSQTNGGAFLLGTGTTSYVTISPDTCFSNNQAMGLALASPQQNLQSCCQTVPQSLLSNYDLTDYDFVQSAKVPSADPVSAGDTFQWTINYIGPLVPSPYTITDNLAPFTLVPGSAAVTTTNSSGTTTHPAVTTTGTPDNPIFTFTPPSADVFTSLTFQVTAPSVPTTTDFDNTAYLNGTYPATGSVTVLADTSLSPNDVLSKDAFPSVANVGDFITYVVTLTKGDA